MEYEIYIDSIFVSSLVLNWLVLSLAGQKAYLPMRLTNKIVGSLLGAVVYTSFLFLPISFLWMRVLLGSMACGYALSCAFLGKVTIKGIERCFEEIMTYSVLLGGLVFCINRFLPFQKETMEVLAIAFLSFTMIWTIKNRWLKQRTLVAKVVLKEKGREVTASALLDTGNGLVEPISGKPVCVVDRELAEKIWEDLDEKLFRVIPFRSVGGNGLLRGYEVEQITVEYEGRQICLYELYLAVKDGAVSGGKRYEMILNPRILGGVLQ